MAASCRGPGPSLPPGRRLIALRRLDPSVCHGVPTLLVAFSESSDHVTVKTDGGQILVQVDGKTHALTRESAMQLRDAVGDALTNRQEFLRTAGEHREDGSYVVERRGADSTGNSALFESFDAACRLFERLPDAFTADDLGSAGYTGSRRHMLVRHFAEHPAFPCELASRNPLRAEKQSSEQAH